MKRFTGWRGRAAIGVTCLVAGASTLSAQSDTERRFVDSLLVSLASIPPGTTLANDPCTAHSRPTARLCTALLALRQDKVALVFPEVRNLVFTVGNRAPKTTSQMMDALLKINQVIFEKPQWGMSYFVLAQKVLDRDHRPDSATKLLRRAAQLPGVAPGMISLTRARIAYEASQRVEGWKFVVLAAGDTSWVSQEFLRRLLGRFLTGPMLEKWDDVPLRGRALWLTQTAGVKEAVADGMTFDPPFRIRTRRYGLESSGSRVIVGFSIGTIELLGDSIGPQQTFFPLRTRLIAEREGDGLQFIVDTVRRFSGTIAPPAAHTSLSYCMTTWQEAHPSTCGQNQKGQVFIWRGILQPPDPWMQSSMELPLPPGRYFLTFTVSQDSGRRGVTTMLPPVTIPPIERTALTMSDLVLGWDGHGVPWRSNTRTIPLNPYSEWSPDAAMTLYAQLSGLKPDADYKVQLDVVSLDPKRANDGQGNRTLNFTEHAASDRVEWYREMSVKGLLPGPYRVTVSVTQGEVTLRRSEEIVVVP